MSIDKAIRRDMEEARVAKEARKHVHKERYAPRGRLYERVRSRGGGPGGMVVIHPREGKKNLLEIQQEEDPNRSKVGGKCGWVSLKQGNEKLFKVYLESVRHFKDKYILVQPSSTKAMFNATPTTEEQESGSMKQGQNLIKITMKLSLGHSNQLSTIELSAFLSAWLTGKTQKAIRVMEILEKHDQADVFAYEALLNGYCKADIVDAANKNLLKEGKWEAGESLMSDMLDKGCEPSCVTYSILICSLCRDGKIVEAENVLKGMKKRGLAPNAYCYNPLISAICKEGKVNLAIEYLNNMISDGGLPSIVSYNSILASLCKNGHADEALNIFEKLGEVGCPPDAISYNTLDGFMDQAIELLVDMMESHKYQPAVINYNAVIYGLCKSRVTKLIKMQQHGGMKEPG
ncbi:hypothetical protein RYX36_025637 [Vicia faba]